MSNPDPLRSQFADLLKQPALDDLQYERLQRRLKRAPQPRFSRMRLAAIACCLALVAVIIPLLSTQLQSDHVSTELYTRISEEVFINHVRINKLDVQASSVEQLRTAMDRLDFRVQDVRPAAKSASLKGARYCTLLGALATQIIFIDDAGQRITQYQTSYDPQRFGSVSLSRKDAQAQKLSKNGLSIYLWQQDGVLVAEAAYDQVQTANLAQVIPTSSFTLLNTY